MYVCKMGQASISIGADMGSVWVKQSCILDTASTDSLCFQQSLSKFPATSRTNEVAREVVNTKRILSTTPSRVL